MDFRISGFAVVVAVLATGLVSGPALAAFTGNTGSTGSASLAVSTGSLAGPASLTGTAGCTRLRAEVRLSWPQPTSTFATGYAVLRKTASTAYVQIATVSGIGTTAYTDTTPERNTTYDFQVRAVFQQWTGSSPVLAVTTPLVCL